VICAIIMSVLAGVFTGCASRAGNRTAAADIPANDPLVYPGAYQLEIPENAQADWLQMLKTAALWSPPIGVPVGTPMIWYGTPDHKTLVLEYYAEALPGDGWTLVHEWESPKQYLTQWSKKSDQLFLALHYDYMAAWIELQNEKYGLDLPIGDGTAIWVMLWKE
jgi:hypothetical protein